MSSYSTCIESVEYAHVYKQRVSIKELPTNHASPTLRKRLTSRSSLAPDIKGFNMGWLTSLILSMLQTEHEGQYQFEVIRTDRPSLTNSVVSRPKDTL